MDPVSHCLLGRTLNCLDAERRIGRGAAAAFVLGSIAPDADSVLVLPGWDVYLRFHEMGTHTLAASPVVAAAVAALLMLVVRKGRIVPLFVAAWLGVVIGHIGFDLVSGSDIRWLAPFSSDRYGWHLLAMADLSAAAILIVGTLLTFWKRRAAAIGTMIALAALLGVKEVTQLRARETYSSALDARGESDAKEGRRRPFAINGSLSAWRFYDRYGGEVRAWHVDSLTRRAILDFARLVPPDSPTIDATRRLRVVRNFLALADVPFPRVEQDGEGQSVFWSDVRFCDRAACGLSFGARLGPDLSPIVQVIRIGGYTQTRAVVSPFSQ